MIMQIFVFITLFLTSVFAYAAEKPADYAYGLAIEASGSEALYDVTLPPAVYQGVTRRDLGDVRVFNAGGEVVPHAWRPRRTEKADAGAVAALTLFPLKAPAGATVDGLAISVRRSASGAVSVDVKSGNAPAPAQMIAGYLVDMSQQDRALRAIDFDWKASEGFSGKLRIDASDDLANWRPLVSGAPLVSLEVGGQRLQQKRVELPSQQSKYLRLAWVKDGAKSPMPELTAATGELAEKFSEAPREWIKLVAAQHVKAGEKASEYGFDSKGQFPIDRLRIELPEPNTIAQVEVLARDKVEQPWRTVTRGVVYRLREGDGEVVSPDINVGASSERYWMLRVDPRGGGLGSGLPTLSAGWVPHQMVFAARGASPFTLAYGSRGAQPGALAIESLIPGYRENAGASVRTARTGTQPTVNVQATSTQLQKELGGEARLQEQIDWKRWSLWGVLGLGVLILGAMAWRLVKQLGSITAGKDDAPPSP
jgi:hypothetical protein